MAPMPFTVELRHSIDDDRPRKTLHGVVLPFDRIEERRQELPLMRGIDPYTDTYFSWIQMRDVFYELAELAADFEGEPRDTLESIIDLAEKGSTEPHNYLVFIGD